MTIIDANRYTYASLTKYDPFNVDEPVITKGGKGGRI